MEQEISAGVTIEVDANSGRRFFSISLSFEATALVIFATCLLVIGLAHSCRAPVAPGRLTTSYVAPVAQNTNVEMEMGLVPKLAAAPDKVAAPAPVQRIAFTARDAAYVKRFQKVAITEMQKFGVPASISLAQGLLESTSGQSELSTRLNNHFGIKCHSRSCKKGHCENYSDDTHKDFFRRFGNAWESWRAHSLLLAHGDRYKSLLAKGNDWRAWAYGLKKAGYATDALYAEKLIDIITKYDLSRLDNEQLFQ